MFIVSNESKKKNYLKEGASLFLHHKLSISFPQLQLDGVVFVPFIWYLTSFSQPYPGPINTFSLKNVSNFIYLSHRVVLPSSSSLLISPLPSAPHSSLLPTQFLFSLSPHPRFSVPTPIVDQFKICLDLV